MSPTQKQGGPSGASPHTTLQEDELEPGDEGDAEEEDEADKAEGSTSGRSRSRYARPVFKMINSRRKYHEIVIWTPTPIFFSANNIQNYIFLSIADKMYSVACVL